MRTITVTWRDSRSYTASTWLGIIQAMKEDSAFTRDLETKQYMKDLKIRARRYERIPARVQGATCEEKARTLLRDLELGGLVRIKAKKES